MDLSNVNFGVCKARKTRLDRVRQQNSDNQRNLSFASVSKRPVRNGGNWQGWLNAHRPCAPQDGQPAGFPPSPAARLPLRAGGNSSPCSQVASVCQTLSEGRARWFQSYLQSCSVFPFSPPPGAVAGSQGRAGRGRLAGGQDCQLHGAQASRRAGKIPGSTAVTKGVLLASGFISPSVPVLTLLVLTGS